MSRSERKKKRSPFKIILIVCLVLVAGAAAYGYSIYHNINKTAKSIHSPLEREPEVKRPTELELSKREPFSVLLLGVDERPDDPGRSDSMIVMTVNPHKNSIDMLSIPRDTLVEIVGKGIDDKINHAYAFGGIEMSMNTVEKFLGIPIDYYIKMNMEGFKEIVDAVGGITVDNDLAFSVDGENFAKGKINLDGESALAFSRMRYDDPRGDFGRQLRQRQVIQGVIDKGANISALWKYDDVLKALGKNVETNLTLEEMMDIQKHYAGARHNIEQFQLEGQGSTINSIWYYLVPEEERNRVSARLQEHLQISEG